MPTVDDLQSVIESDLTKAVAGYRSRLAPFARRMDPDDLFQATAMRAYVGFRNFRGESVEELRGWVRAVAHSTYQGVVRHEMADRRSIKAEQFESDILTQVIAVSHKDAASLSEEFDRAIACVDGLAQHHRDAIRMRFLEGMSYEDMAERTGFGVEKLRAFVYRGLCRVRESLSE